MSTSTTSATSSSSSSSSSSAPYAGPGPTSSASVSSPSGAAARRALEDSKQRRVSFPAAQMDDLQGRMTIGALSIPTEESSANQIDWAALCPIDPLKGPLDVVPAPSLIQEARHITHPLTLCILESVLLCVARNRLDDAINFACESRCVMTMAQSFSNDLCDAREGSLRFVLNLWEILFRRGQGFKQAAAWATANFAHSDGVRHTAAVYLFQELIRYRKEYDAAFSAGKAALNSTSIKVRSDAGYLLADLVKRNVKVSEIQALCKEHPKTNLSFQVKLALENPRK